MELYEYDKRALSELESVFVQAVYNNSRQIRYPIQFKDGERLKGTMGRNVRLNTEGVDGDMLLSGRYVFGANSVYIYQALKDMIDYIRTETDIDLFEAFGNKYEMEEEGF